MGWTKRMNMHGNRKQILFACVSVLIGISAATGILFLGEVAVRMGTNINFLGTSSHLFAAKRFGASRGNAPSIRALSYEATVYTDSNGFRIPRPDYQYPGTQSDHVLILGDSVAFGPGVAEEKTFAGQLRTSKPDWAIFNAAVIGYDVDDYLNVVRSLIDEGHRYKFVVLIMCLNDVSGDSARLLNNSPMPPGFSTVETIRKLDFASAANDWLRNNSKLYLYVKGLVTDPPARHFYADYSNYVGKVDRQLSVVTEVAATLRRAGMPLLVVIAPYAYQIRERDGKAPKDRVDGDLLLPQRKIVTFLRGMGVTTYDSTGFFESQTAGVSSDLFLPFDAMHFSKKGHAVMYMFIDRLLHSEKLL